MCNRVLRGRRCQKKRDKSESACVDEFLLTDVAVSPRICQNAKRNLPRANTRTRKKRRKKKVTPLTVTKTQVKTLGLILLNEQ